MNTLQLDNVLIPRTLEDITNTFSEKDLLMKIPFIMEELDKDTKSLVKEYQAILSEGNYNEATAYRTDHPELETRILDAYKANILARKIANVYLYAKAQLNQMAISTDEPEKLILKDDESGFEGQEDGDIWLNGDLDYKMKLKINEEYKDIAISPITAKESDISEINFDKDDESPITNPHRLVNLKDLALYNETVVSSGISGRKNLDFMGFYESYKMKIAEAYQKTHKNLEVPEDFMKFVKSGLLPEEENYKPIINSFISDNFFNIQNKEFRIFSDKEQIQPLYSFTVNNVKYFEPENKEYILGFPTYDDIALLSYVKIKCCYELTTNLYTDQTMTKSYNSGKNDSISVSDSPYEFKGYVYKSPSIHSASYNTLIMNVKNAITKDSCYFAFDDDNSQIGMFKIRINNCDYVVKEQKNNYYEVKTYRFCLANEIDIITLY